MKKDSNTDPQHKLIITKISRFISETAKLYWHDLETNEILRKEVIAELKRFHFFMPNDLKDKKNISQSALFISFLLYTKLIVYIQLQKESKHLHLKKIDSFDTIQDRFNDAGKSGYRFIFDTSDQDSVLYENILIHDNTLKELEKLTINDFKTDILGSIYNNLLNNSEQTEKGQHFTSNNEIDLINSFCIKPDTTNIVDTASGSGAFLVRAFYRLKYLHPDYYSEEITQKLKGIDVAKMPVLLAKINMLLLNIHEKHRGENIINKDFIAVNKVDKSFNSLFDACIGNPPYIRQELIKNKAQWSKVIQQDFEIKKINKQSDLYVYYLMHTASLLKEGGRLGYVIASSWLDVSYGKDLQKFLLDHFKIIAIIDQQSTRSFQTASVNTVILIIEKCSAKKERENNLVKFVRILNDYSDLSGKVEDTERFKKLDFFVQNIENTKSNSKTNYTSVKCINQKELEQSSTDNHKYQNGHWGARFFRTPELYHEIIHKSKNKLVPLKDICEVKYGIKTGANSFFYLLDETDKAVSEIEKTKKFLADYGRYHSTLDDKHYIIERKYVKPILKSQREVKGLVIKRDSLKYNVLYVTDNRNVVKKSKSDIYRYIQKAESSQYKINRRPTCIARQSADGSSDWFNLGKEIITGDFIIPSKIGERFRLLDNRKAKVYCDKVNYKIIIKPEFTAYADILFAILNSTLFRHFIDLFSRQLTGSQTLSDVDVNVIQNTLIPHPESLLKHEKELQEIMHLMSQREQKSIFEEIDMDDRRELDQIIMQALGFGKKQTTQLQKNAVKLVQDRKDKSESVKTVKRPVKVV